MDNNRTILAVVLIVLLWSGYSLFLAPQPQVQSVESENTAVVATDSEKGPVSTVNESVNGTGTVLDGLISNTEEKIYKVETDFFHMRFSSIGASLRFIDLKNYKETNDADSESFILFDEKDNLATLLTSGSGGLSIPTNLNYALVGADSDSIRISDTNNRIDFVAKTNDLIINKSYVFNGDSYSFDIVYKIQNNKQETVSGDFSISLLTPYDKEEKTQMYTFVGPQTYDGNDLLEDKVDDLEKSPKIYKDNIVWSGFTSKYFISILNPNENYSQIYVNYDNGIVENKFIISSISLSPNQVKEFTYTAYFGPKDFDLLAQGNHRFEETINYGFFHPLAKPLMVTLKFFYGFLGNYGFAIILLTICIKIIFWPLTQKSYKSMKGMQKLQPEMKRLREKFGSDKQRLNQEMMAFYKEHKVNPLGGCLPMLIQIPVFFALYRVLLGSIELRHAPFMLWITDLSAKDPYYVTPLIMGVTMFLQQKMTPTQMDPTQEKIMLMMPVIFTFMFLNFPSGLVIYWLINNLLTILQQYLIRRQPD